MNSVGKRVHSGRQIGMALMLGTWLSGCATTQPVAPTVEYKTVVVDTGCTWAKIITVGKDDVLSDDTAKQILAHDRAWVKNCRDPKGEK